jgi:hypothetical protein
MLAPFFVLAGQSPTRQFTLRRVVVAHVGLLLGLALIASRQKPGEGSVLFGDLLLVAGIVEGAILVGWRLAQMPKSQALEFLLVSPIQPRRVLFAEALVGLSMLSLVTLSGLPALMIFAASGVIDPLDVPVLVVMPFTWGAVTGLGLTAWAYEPKRLRKIGEVVVVLLILLYLVVGVLAGENLRLWLSLLPEDGKITCLRAFSGLHTHNPFGALRHWLQNEPAVAWERLLYLEAIGLALIALLLWRASARLLGHFHERHYDPVRDVTNQARPAVGDRPLSWWAVKRVSEYSGRINLWLAGGFCLTYAAYVVAQDHWPAWMGKHIFRMCDEAGGVAALTAALVVLAAVPASFQYGLWDANAQARCRRLELLLLTDLQPRDYWDAACSAAWRRGRGYFAVALLLWGAAVIGGRLSVAQALAGLSAGALLWALYFALGFRAFARGAQANGLGMILTVGLPLATVALHRLGLPTAATWLPPGMVYAAGDGALAWLVGPAAAAALTLLLARQTLARCDASLRRWYDDNAGRKVAG